MLTVLELPTVRIMRQGRLYMVQDEAGDTIGTASDLEFALFAAAQLAEEDGQLPQGLAVPVPQGLPEQALACWRGTGDKAAFHALYVAWHAAR